MQYIVRYLQILTKTRSKMCRVNPRLAVNTKTGVHQICISPGTGNLQPPVQPHANTSTAVRAQAAAAQRYWFLLWPTSYDRAFVTTIYTTQYIMAVSLLPVTTTI